MRASDCILSSGGAHHEARGGEDAGLMSLAHCLVYRGVNAEVIRGDNQKFQDSLRTGHRSRAASRHCQEIRAGTPHSTSRMRLAIETANASSLLIPKVCPNRTNAASCTPSPAGITKARWRMACIIDSSMIA